MKFIDFHCDSLMLAARDNRLDLFDAPTAMLDVKRMKEAGQLAQFFAIFMPPLDRKPIPPAESATQSSPPADSNAPDGEPFDDYKYIHHCLAAYHNTLSQHKDIIAGPPLAGGSSGIEQNERSGKMTMLLTFEDGRPIEGSLEKLEAYYYEGIRLITLTWNGENCFGFPNSSDAEKMKLGLKPFGKDAVRRMNELGMLVDVSHLSDRGFYDVAEISAKPFIASHSNCRSLGPHQRNLTDEMIRILADSGGVAGLNYCPAFLNKDAACADSTAALISLHAQHLKNIGGIGCVALGSDFDGIDGKLEIGRVEQMPLLFDRFRQDGFTEDEIEQIAWKNAARVIKDVMG
ncbi:peptidase [Spirochaetia bacterium]|nr:peptidase [Spirochaetia bacterium]